MDGTLPAPNGHANPFPEKPLDRIDPIHRLSHRLTPDQMERGRRLGCLRAKQLRLQKQIKILLAELTNVTSSLDSLSPESPDSWTPQSPEGISTAEERLLSLLGLSSSFRRGEKKDKTPLRESSLRARGANRQPMRFVDFSPGFLAFWSLYPRRLKKRDAFRAWLDLNPDADLEARMLDACRLQAKHVWPGTEARFIPYPASWLRAGRWEDEITPTAKEDLRGHAQRAFDQYITEELAKEQHEQGTNGTHRPASL
jgi:hypothetical protein